MLMTAESNNMQTVRSALAGITGVEQVLAAVPRQDWYMLIVRANHEVEAVDSLRRHGLRAYWPSFERLIASRRQFEGRPVRRLVRIGLLPYVFSPVVGSIDFMTVMESVVGVFDVVRSRSGVPVIVGDIDIGLIRAIAHGESNVTPGAPRRAFKLGERVRFVDDVTAHWPPGRIIKLARDARITVEIDLMGRQVPITVLPHQIEPT
jgi:transcription antitermination factor NusG